MNRAGRIRLSIYDRQVTIVHAIARLQYQKRKRATLYSIASMLNMTPSTHLRRVLDAMVCAGKISKQVEINGRGQSVSIYTVKARSCQWCELPWECDEMCVISETLEVCIGDETMKHFKAQNER